MKKTHLALMALTACLIFAQRAHTEGEEQDWYTWYEEQNRTAAQDEAEQYEQYYEEASSDVSESPDAGQNPNASDEAWENPSEGQNEAPAAETEQQQDESEAEWIWGQEGPPPDEAPGGTEQGNMETPPGE